MEFQYLVLPWILLNSKKKAMQNVVWGEYAYLIKGAFRLGNMRLVIKNEREATSLVAQALH